MAEAEPDRRWPNRHRARADFDPQARRQETRARTGRHNRYPGGAPTDGSTTPWSRRSPGRSGGADLLEIGEYATIREIASPAHWFLLRLSDFPARAKFKLQAIG